MTDETTTFFVKDGWLNGEEGVYATYVATDESYVDGWYLLIEGMDDGIGPFETQARARQPWPLDPCPFCGSSAGIERWGNHRRSMIYSCDDCGCRLETGEEPGRYTTQLRWNTRWRKE